jgi:hypothetical protein
MEQMARQIELEKLQSSRVVSQTNIQINDASDGTKYGNLIQQLVKMDEKK